jgi:hypothetical protein
VRSCFKYLPERGCNCIHVAGHHLKVPFLAHPLPFTTAARFALHARQYPATATVIRFGLANAGEHAVETANQCAFAAAHVSLPSGQTIDQLCKSNKAEVASFTLYIVGEGIEKKVTDFAAEVAAQAAAAAR